MFQLKTTATDNNQKWIFIEVVAKSYLEKECYCSCYFFGDANFIRFWLRQVEIMDLSQKQNLG